MSNGYKRYTGEQIDVLFDSEKCAHAAKCVKGLPGVFDIKKKPWINVDGAAAEEITKVIDQCPSGALQYIRKDSEQ